MLQVLTGVQTSCKSFVNPYDFDVPFIAALYFFLYILITHPATYSCFTNTSQDFITVKSSLLLTKLIIILPAAKLFPMKVVHISYCICALSCTILEGRKGVAYEEPRPGN